MFFVKVFLDNFVRFSEDSVIISAKNSFPDCDKEEHSNSGTNDTKVRTCPGFRYTVP